MPSIDSMTKFWLPFLIEQGTVVSKRGIVRQGGAQEHAQRCSAVTAHRAEAAHLFQIDGAPISKMLSA